MKTQDLKLFCGEKIMTSDLSKSAKLSLLNYVQHEANEHQLMGLILDGKVMNYDKDAAAIVKDRFVAAGYPQKITEAGVAGNVFGILFFGPLHWAIWRGILALNDKCQKKCGAFKISKDRDACVQRCKIATSQKKLAAIKSQTAKCAKAPDPAKCKAAAQQAAKQVQLDMSKAEAKLKKLASKGRAAMTTDEIGED